MIVRFVIFLGIVPIAIHHPLAAIIPMAAAARLHRKGYW